MPAKLCTKQVWRKSWYINVQVLLKEFSFQPGMHCTPSALVGQNSLIA